MNAKDLYNVNVSAGGSSINTQDVTTINILSSDCNFPDRTRRYSNLDDLAADVIGGRSCLTFKTAQIIKSQNIASKEILITNVGSNRAVVFNGAMTAGSISMLVNGKLYTQDWITGKPETIAALIVKLETDDFTVSTIDSGDVITGNVAVIIGCEGITYIKSVTITGSTTLTAAVCQMGYILENNGTFTSGTIQYQTNGSGDTSGPKIGQGPLVGKTYYEEPFYTSKAATFAALEGNILSNSDSNNIVAFKHLSISGSGVVGSALVWVAAIGKQAYFDILQIERSSISTDTLTLAEGYFWSQAALSFTGEDVVDALVAGIASDGSWLIFVDTMGGSDHSLVIANQKALAAWAETDKESFYKGITQAVDSYYTESETTSVMGAAFSGEYQCSVIVATKQFNRYHMGNIAYAGKIAPLKPGSCDSYMLPLKGVEPDYFTASEQAIIKGKNGEFLSLYRDNRTGTVFNAVTSVGKTADGEWVSIAIGAMWIKALVLYTCAGNQMNLNNIGQKLPFSRRGFAIQESWIRSAMNQALPSTGYAGFLTDLESDDTGNVIGGFYVVYPDIASISASDKEKGDLVGVTVTGFLSEAIRHTTINIGLIY